MVKVDKKNCVNFQNECKWNILLFMTVKILNFTFPHYYQFHQYSSLSLFPEFRISRPTLKNCITSALWRRVLHRFIKVFPQFKREYPVMTFFLFRAGKNSLPAAFFRPEIRPADSLLTRPGKINGSRLLSSCCGKCNKNNAERNFTQFLRTNSTLNNKQKPTPPTWKKGEQFFFHIQWAVS